MRIPSLRIGLCLALDTALLVVCFLNLPILLDRARPPCDLAEIDGRVVVTAILDHSAAGSLRSGDMLQTWNGEPVQTEHEVEFLSDFASIGDSVPVSAGNGWISFGTSVQLIAAYDLTYGIIMVFVGVVSWGLGVFVLIRRPREPAAFVLHWSMVLMGATVMLTMGKVVLPGMWAYVTRVLFFLCYGGVAAAFLHLTLLFPNALSRRVWRAVGVYLPMALLVGAMSVTHLQAMTGRSLDDYDTFQVLFDIFHLVLVFYVGTGILLFVRSCQGSRTVEEQKKLKWILWGLVVGPLPFLLFTIIPQYYLPFGFVPEEYTLVFLAVIPIAFAISFVRYHVFDIEVVVNRTTVYGLVLSAVIAVYVVVVALAAAYVGTHTVGTSVGAAVLVALLFEPVRKRVQHVVDKRFFRVRYNFREALRRLSDEIRFCVDPKQLADLLIGRITEIIPVERIGVFLLRQSDMHLFVLSQRGFGMLERRTVRFQVEKLTTELLLPVALDGKVEPGVVHESADQRVFGRWSMALVLPMKSAAGEFVGFIVLGSKKSGERFTLEDVDLLVSVATVSGVEFERIALQRKLIEQAAENQRLAELNRMKSDFVSNVSHELRTPLTSIRMYAELLEANGHASQRKRRAYAGTIVGEAERLDRLVGTILDSAKIEAGTRRYRMEDIDLRESLAGVLATMKYQLEKHRFLVTYRKPEAPLIIMADPDAVAEALINLIDNAIKFSPARKILELALIGKRNSIICSVKDRGCGIPARSIPRLFDRFYREPGSSASVQGVGLGLPLVRHIMQAHGGKVTVRSTVGRGSTFSLVFPRRRTPS